MLWWSADSQGPLLAFAQSSIASTGGVILLALEATAIGEMLVEIPSREASATSVLTWDEVCTGWSSSSDFWGGGIGTATWLGPLRVYFQTHSQTFPALHGIGDSLPPCPCCPLLLILGAGLIWTGHNDGGDLTKRWYLLVWVLHQEWQNINFQVNRLTCGKTYATGQQLW